MDAFAILPPMVRKNIYSYFKIIDVIDERVALCA